MPTTAERLAAALHGRYPNNSVAPKHYGKLLLSYAESGFGPPHLVDEIETGDEGKFWSAVWEAMLYGQFVSEGCTLRRTSKPSGQNGPDFRIDQRGQTIWIEAIVPSPEGIPTDWLSSPSTNDFKVREKPNEQMLLRCTSAIASKRDKIASYRSKGIIGAHDCAVIAINICRLSDWDVDGNGISQLPLAVEAVFPIGPLGVPITRDGKIAGPAQHIPRFAVPKVNGTAIPTYAFLDARFEDVSAVVQGHQKDLYKSNLALATVHNPLAINAIPLGLFGRQREYVAKSDGDDYQLGDIAV